MPPPTDNPTTDTVVEPSGSDTNNNKDKITCHVLDTTRGTPARGMRVRLELTPTSSSPPHHHSGGPGSGAPRTFESQTDEDGRVKTWLPYSASNASGEVPVYTLDDVLEEVAGSSAAAKVDVEGESAAAASDVSRWTLRFDTGAYFAGTGNDVETFFPEVAVVFEVRNGQQYHVPLLLSPFGYTTYRGS